MLSLMISSPDWLLPALVCNPRCFLNALAFSPPPFCHSAANLCSEYSHSLPPSLPPPFSNGFVFKLVRIKTVRLMQSVCLIDLDLPFPSPGKMFPVFENPPLLNVSSSWLTKTDQILYCMGIYNLQVFITTIHSHHKRHLLRHGHLLLHPLHFPPT